MSELLQSMVKSQGWQEAKCILEKCVSEERESITYKNVDDAVVGQEYKALRLAKNIVTRAISKIENSTNLGELRPKRVLR